MLRRLGIRAKVLAVLAVPVLVLMLTAAYIALQSVGQARTAGTVDEIVSVLPKYARTAEALQQERTLSVQLASDSDLGGSISASRSATDDAVAALGVALREIDLSGLDARVAAAVQDATNAHTELVAIRDRVDAGQIPASLVDSNYTDIVTADNDVPVVVAETLSERSLASRLSAYGAVADTIEQVLRAQPTATSVLQDDGADPAEVRELAALFAVQDQSRDDARDITNTLRLPGVQLSSRDADLTAMQLSLVSGNELTVSALDPVRWNSLVNAELATLRPVGDDLLTSASERAAAVATDARNEALITVGITLAAAALSILIALVVSRGIVIPMRRLTAAAGQVREELPRLVEQVAVPGESPDLTLADIPVVSQDEVGRLAQAFNDVNATTIQVAREQAALRGSIAEMFVNVARRDQVLLGRQLAFIDSLERSEEDPATLANLFRLDHLATRMRRNAESLLVLAGIDSGRRLREAMPLSDVVRTASSEIEQYDRVQLELGVDPLMHGFNALAAAHLLAELLENATLFSEPGTPVVVATSVDGDHVVVHVTDQGLGMSPEEIEQANATIGTTSPTEALGAQRLGLFVVARLAQRLGARVRLERLAGADGTGASGTVAVVEFPVALFTAHDPALAGGLDTQRSARAATGATPVVDAPPAVPVDLAALTDGATSTGLPRRRSAADGPVPPAVPAPGDQDVVLPAPAEATLAPEIAAEAGGWTPMVAPPAAGPAPLPSRGTLPGRVPALPAADDGAAPAPAAGPRAGLFAGFRGREAVAADVPAADPAAVDAEVPDALPAVPGLEPEPLIEDELAPEAAPAAPEPEPLVVPGLAPDEPLDESHAWAAWAEPIAPQPVVPVTGEGPVVHEPDALPYADETQVLPPLALDGPADDAAWPAAPWQSAPLPVAADPVLPSPFPSGTFAPEPFAPDAFAPDGFAPGPVADGRWVEPPAVTGSFATAAFAAGPALPTVPAPAAEPDAPVAPPAADLAQPPAPARASAWTQAPAAAQPDQAEQPSAGFATPGPVPAPEPAAATPPLPDFATLLQGDATEQVEPAHRPRARRSFFSLRRKPRSASEPVAAAPAAPVPAAPAPAPAVAAPAEAPAWAATATPPGVPVLPGVEGLPATAPLAPDASADPSGAWEPSAAWSPLDAAGLASAPQDAPAAVAPHVPVPPAFTLPAFDPETAGSGWSAPESGAPVLPGAFPVGAGSEPGVAPAPFVPTFGAPAAAGVVAPDAAAALADAALAEAAESWAAPAEPAGAPLPTRTRGEVPPPVPAPTGASITERRPPRDISTWASSWSPDGAGTGDSPFPAWPTQPAPGAQQPQAAGSVAGDHPSGVPGQHTGQPNGQRPGGMDAEAAAMLARRADIQEQALSELSQLSAYRPKVDARPAGGNGSLTRRVPTAIPAAPEITTTASGEAPARDADGLRSRLSSFQSGTRRGRRAQAEAGDGTEGAQDLAGQSGHELQPAEPDQQQTSPSW